MRIFLDWLYLFNSLHQVDAVFYQRLARILRLVIPGLRSKEALLLVMHSSLLIFRTAISLYVAALDGK
jgi:ATP-binding cassette subfamily D (ALD) long-chain fatty acid import protein